MASTTDAAGAIDFGESDVNHDTLSMDKRETEVLQLARLFTQQSLYPTSGQNPFTTDPGYALDPISRNTNTRRGLGSFTEGYLGHSSDQTEQITVRISDSTYDVRISIIRPLGIGNWLASWLSPSSQPESRQPHRNPSRSTINH
jgi:hypothetical protein